MRSPRRDRLRDSLRAGPGHGAATAADEEETLEGPEGASRGSSTGWSGPPAGGRVSRVAGVPGDPLTYYAATASGGVWKSTDGGIQWKPVFDDQETSSIGSIAVAPSDPNVVYVGSGEANIRGNVAQGNGIYKSTDAGKTWQHVWKQDGQIGTMVVHPSEPRRRLRGRPRQALRPEPRARRLSHAGRREDVGEGPATADADTGASDVALDPKNPRIVFAGLWQARRRPWELVSGGPGSWPPRLARRRRHVEEAHGQGAARGHLGQGRRRGGAVSPAARLRARRGREGRPLPLGRRRRDLVARERPPRAAAAGLVLLDAHRRPAEPGRRVVPAGADAEDGGRREDDQEREGHPPRRPPRRVDRPREPEADDRRERRRGGRLDRRRGDLVRAACCRSRSSTTWRPTPRCRTASSARCRTSARPRGRATASPPRASRTATGTRSAAARRATPWPTPPIPTSCTPASTSAS